MRVSIVKADLGWTDSPVCYVFGDPPAFQGIDRAGFFEASRLCFGRQARRDAFVQLLGNMAEPRPYFGVNFKTVLMGVERAALAAYVRDNSAMRESWAVALAEINKGLLYQWIWPGKPV